MVSRFPLTLLGLLVIALAGWAWWAGRARMDIVLTLVGLWAWVLVTVLGLAVVGAAWRVRTAYRSAVPVAAGRLEGVAGHILDGPVRPARKALPLAARPRISWSVPRGAVRLVDDAPHMREEVLPSERRLSGEIVRVVEVHDVLGIWRLRWRLRQEHAVRVLPDTGRLRVEDLESCLASGDLLPYPEGPAEGDRVDSRPYTRSDPARMILWKVYARSRELMVRTPETARAPERSPLLYLVAGQDDEPAAAVARLLCGGRLLTEGARLAADGTPDPVADPDAALDAIVRSADHRHRSALDLTTALDAGAHAGLEGAVVVCPARSGAHVDRLVEHFAPSPERYLVIAAGDASPPAPAPRSRWERTFLQPAAPAGHTFAEMVRAVEPLVRARIRVVLADRVSGRLEVLT